MKSLAPGSANGLAAQSLYAIEEYLAILVDTAELVPPEQAQEFIEEFQAALSTCVDKRDRVGQFMAHLEHQIAFANFEIDRLKQRKAAYQRAFERIEAFVTHTIEFLGRDAKGRYRKLEGKTVTFSLAGCPPSVEVTDEAAVPAEYKTLTLKLPADVWEQILEWLEADQREVLFGDVTVQDISVDKRSIKAAIQAGTKVPGADLAIGNTSLRRS
jgi:Siphovirus Gp157